MLHAALRYKRPVYVELPRDMVKVPGRPYHQPAELQERSDPPALKAALAEAAEMINRSRKPVILADVEVHRFGLQEVLLKLVGQTNIPVAATLLGKSVIGEQHPFYLGVYEGAMGREEVRRYVEASDCVIMLGTFMTDINLGVFTAQLDPARCISATSEKLSIRYHNYDGVVFKDFMRGLLRAQLRPRSRGRWLKPRRHRTVLGPPRNIPLTVTRLFQRLDTFLTEETMVVSDVGDALFGAADLLIRHRSEFLSPAYYTSMGFAVPPELACKWRCRGGVRWYWWATAHFK